MPPRFAAHLARIDAVLVRRCPWLRLSAGDRYALWVCLGFKAALLLLGTIGFIVFQNRYPEGRGLWPYLTIWNRWDATAYLAIADHGYTSKDEQYLAFFPLFPMLVRLARPFVFHDTLSAAFAVSTVASLFMAVQWHRLVLLDLGPRPARRAVWFFFAFPTAYFLHIGYTEAVFFAVTFASMRYARTGRWWLAGIFGGLSAAARMNGVLLLALFLTEALREARQRRRFPTVSLLSVPLTLLGTAVYLFINDRVGGSPFAFMTYQRIHWFHHLVPPWEGILDSVHFAAAASPGNALMVGLAEAVAALLVFAVGVYALRMRPIGYALWTLLNVILWSSNDFIMSGPRYALIAVPLFLILARVSVKPTANAVLTAFFVLLQGLFATIFAQGRWAF